MGQCASTKQENDTESDDESEIEAEKETKALELEKIEQIKKMYNDGIPLFTKDSIRALHQQLLKAKTGDKVWVLNLDGSKSEFEIEVGKCFNGPGEGIETVRTQVSIYYQSIQHLTWSKENWEFVDFCTMPIHHLTQIRDKVTKEFCGRSLPRPDLLREEAEAFFRTCCEEWETSEACKQFRAILDAAKIPVGIAKIVAFACGTFSYISQKPVHSRGISRAATQHALILTVRDVLGKKKDGGSGEIVCYAQDPVYSELDKEILQQSGIQILDDPAGFLEVDESAVVLSFCPNVCVRQVVCDIARPAMMIWDSVILDEDQMEEGRRR
ncbi:hypothetical protein V8E51_016364 [Hyaloscypha variabilis]